MSVLTLPASWCTYVSVELDASFPVYQLTATNSRVCHATVFSSLDMCVAILGFFLFKKTLRELLNASVLELLLLLDILF